MALAVIDLPIAGGSPLNLTAPRHARYPVRDADTGKWKSVSWSELKTLTGKHAPKKGTLELFAQSVEIHFKRTEFLEEAGGRHYDCWQSRQVLVPPVFLSSTSASCLAAAEAQAPCWLEDLLLLASVRRWGLPSIVVLPSRPPVD